MGVVNYYYWNKRFQYRKVVGAIAVTLKLSDAWCARVRAGPSKCHTGSY